jgi:eukaryotic-like serine/threonine-protein kinase
MGLLMRRTLIILSIATVAAGCSGLKLTAPLRHQDTGIIMHGAGPARNNDLPGIPGPPLFPEWEADVAAGIGDGAPCLVDSILIGGNLRGELFAYNAITGKRIGWVTLGGAVQGTPVINGNIAYVPLSGGRESMVAYDLTQARIRWHFTGGDVQVSPLLLGVSLYIANVNGVLTCLSLASGEKIWSYALPGNTTVKGIRSSPAGSDSSVVFGADDGYLYCCNAHTGVLRWRVNAHSPVQATPVINNGTVFVGTLGGEFIAVGMLDGKVLWSSTPGAQIYGSALVDSTCAIVGTTGGHIVAMDSRTGAVRWDADLRSPVNSGLLGAGDILYTGTLKKELLALKRSSGEIVWRAATDGRIKTTPIGGLGRIFVAQDSPLIQAYRGAR